MTAPSLSGVGGKYNFYNDFGLYYERLVNGYHGFVIGFINHIPEDYKIDTGLGFSLGYRFHFSKKMGSYFLGPVFSFMRTDDARSTEFGETYRGDVQVTTIALTAGRRWIWENGFTIVARIGYPLEHDVKTLNLVDSGGVRPSSYDGEDLVNDVEELKFGDGIEFSLGYAF